MRIWRIISAALSGGALLVWTMAAEAANPRIALVIGEQNYADAQVPTAANDAGLIAEVLQAAGFDVVGARDLDQKSVREALRDFLDKANSAGPDMQAFVYFSGRGLQYAGDNFLVPIDARIARASDAPIEAVKLSDFTHALAAAPGLARVVVIDAARANPYAQQGEPLAGGLALVEPEANSILAFNAAPGAIGVQENEGYGVYAKTLAGLMRQGGADIRDVLGQTRVAVNEKTQGAQIPWSAGKLDSPYFLFERAADAPPVVVKRPPAKKPLKDLSAEDAYQVAVDRDTLDDYEEFLRAHARSQQAKRIAAIIAARREALFWRRTLDQNNPRAYWTYLRRYPRGPHANDAGWRLDALAARREPPPDFVVLDYQDLPPPPREELVYADRPVYYFGGDDFGPPPPRPPRGYYAEDDDDWRDLPPPPPPTVAGVLPALIVAIPLALTARAYSDRPRADGRAPVSAPPPAPRPFAPPPLPRGVQVQATPAPTPGGKPPPPTPAAPGSKPLAPPPSPVVAPAATPTPAAGKPVTPLPSPAAAPTAAPAPIAKPLAPTPSPTLAPTASPVPAGGKPLTPLPSPSSIPPATPAPTGGKPLTPLPSPPPAPTQAPTGGKPLTPLPSPTPTPTGGKPLATPTAPPSPAPLRTPSAEKAPPTPLPSATPEPKALSETPEGKAAGDKQHRRPPKTPADESPSAPKPSPLASPKPDAEMLKSAPKAVEAPKPAPPAAEAPKPLPPKPAVEAPKPPPPKPAVEAPKPAVEAPKPPPPKPAVEAPKPPPPKPAAEAPKPPPAKPAGEAGKAACGHPGQPAC
jgi:uncharacterized caspase-like protein